MTKAETQATATAADTADTPAGQVTITLDYPLQRGSAQIDTVTVRKPLTGQLTGVKLTDLLSLEVGAIAQLLPRITTPTLLAHEIKQLDPADFTELGATVAGFFVKKNIREASLSA